MKKTKNISTVLYISLIMLFFTKDIYSQKKPNIIFILTDDLGYGDVGVFFQNHRRKENNRAKPWASTPNLDKMASEGAILTNHYTAAPVCAPSRASLMSGLSQGHCNIRNSQFDKAIADNYTMANVLQMIGYKTAAIGKWGLQGDKRWSDNGHLWPAHPNKRGFDYFYGYMRHKDGHEHYPKEAPYRNKAEVYENENEVSQSLDKCYTGDLWTAAAKKWIIENTKGKNNHPFFMYLAYDTPHAVLELPTQKYPDGGGLNGGLQWIGKPGKMINTASGTIDSWMHPEYKNNTYDHDNDSATAEVAWPEVYKRYATSTRRIDDGIGDIFKLLSDLKIDDNTIVVFSSDNGPSLESYIPDMKNTPDFFDSYGPFDGVKRDVLEGGERMPLIVRWPNKIPPNQIIETPSIAYDWLPTFVDAAGMSAPEKMDGVSLLPSLIQKGKQQESLIYVEYLHNKKTPGFNTFTPKNRKRIRKQMQMLRLGNVVGLRYNITDPKANFELYNIKSDTHQANDLTGTSPYFINLQQKMKNRVLQVRMPDNKAPRPYDTEFIPPINLKKKLKNGATYKVYKTNTPWLANVNTLEAVGKGNIKTISVNQINFEKDSNICLIKGFLKIPENGTYTFALNASNKSYLRIHDISVIDADYGYKGGKVLENNLRLQKGYHPITITFKKSDTKNKLEISFKSENGKYNPISKILYRIVK